MRTLNLWTDDRWNPAHRAPGAMRGYDSWSPGRANMSICRRWVVRAFATCHLATTRGTSIRSLRGTVPDTALASGVVLLEAGMVTEHRYFCDGADMVERVRWLLAHDAKRVRLARSARARVTGGVHTYAARLAANAGTAGPVRSALR